MQDIIKEKETPWTDFIDAIKNGQLEQTEQLLLKIKENHIDIDRIDKTFSSTPLMFASILKKQSIAQLLLSNGANPNKANESGLTPLSIATQNALIETINLLLQNGADPNQSNKHGLTPLHLATQKGCTDTVKTLLQNGANPNIVDKNLQIPFEIAKQQHGVNSEIAKLLRRPNTNQRILKSNLRKYVELYRVDDSFIPFAHKPQEKDICINLNNFEILDKLLSSPGYCHGLSILWAFAQFLENQPKTDKPRDDFTWFKSTVEFICDLDNQLIKKLTLNVKQQEILQEINEGKSLKEKLFKSFTSEQQTKFIEFTKELESKAERFLLYMGYAQNHLNTDLWHGDTKLSLTKGDVSKLSPYSVMANKDKLTDPILELFPDNQPPVIDSATIIGSHGHAIALKKTTMNGKQYMVCYNSNSSLEAIIPIEDKESIVNFIWENMPDFDANKDSPLDFTQLVYSARPLTEEEIKEIEKRHPPHKDFLENVGGSDPYDPNYVDGWTALHSAARNGGIESARVLIENHNNDLSYINQANKDGFTPLYVASEKGHAEIVSLLLQKGAAPNLADKNDVTPLHIAIANEHAEIVNLLLNNGANPNLPDKNGFTLLYAASANGDMKTVKILLENKADLSLADKNGLTPLHVAIANEHVEIVNLLLQNGANPNQADINGETPLNHAEKYGNNDILKMLNSANAFRRAIETSKQPPFLFFQTPKEYVPSLLCEAKKENKKLFAALIKLELEKERTPLFAFINDPSVWGSNKDRLEYCKQLLQVVYS